MWGKNLKTRFDSVDEIFQIIEYYSSVVLQMMVLTSKTVGRAKF